MWVFCGSMCNSALQSGLPAYCWVGLAITLCSVYLCLNRQSPSCRTTSFVFLLIGAFVLVLSYMIYGLSAEHMPSLDTWLNRVNMGGSLGACLLLVGVLSMLRTSHTEVETSTEEGTTCRLLKPFLRPSVFALIVTAFTAFFILADWQLAKPWIVSWNAQKELMSVIKQHASEIRSGDSVIIGGITRYTSRCTAVVDGVWDFQNILRTTLNNKTIYGTVVTERLLLDNDKLVDKFGTSILGTFPLKQMILYAPDKSAWIRISTRQEFIQKAQQLGWHIQEVRQAPQSPSIQSLSHQNTP